jgi:hypothetical protein
MLSLTLIEKSRRFDGAFQEIVLLFRAVHLNFFSQIRAGCSVRKLITFLY